MSITIHPDEPGEPVGTLFRADKPPAQRKSAEQLARDLRSVAGRLNRAADHLINVEYFRDGDPDRECHDAELIVLAALGRLGGIHRLDREGRRERTRR